jgi:hypothetical protein
MSLDGNISQQHRRQQINQKTTMGKFPNKTKRHGGIQVIHILIAIFVLAIILMWAGNVRALQSIEKTQTSYLPVKPALLDAKEPQKNLLVSVVDNKLIQTNTFHTVSSPYSYAWVLGAIHEDKWAYKGFLWDIIISANLFRKQGSTADFWIFVRLSPDSKLDDLPLEDRRLLEEAGINIKLLDKPKKESFARLVFDKFLTINMTDYKRVMFLDGDLIPLVNLDYIFHLSDADHTATPTLIKPNLIMASWREPCNTGMFMVEPSVEAFAKYNDALLKHREKAKKLLYPHFDFTEGWGRNFVEHGETWRSAKQNRAKRWRFHASHSDQGLMFYWSKYLIQDVTIVISNIVENWKRGPDGDPVRESELKDVFAPYQEKPLVYQWSCKKSDDKKDNTEIQNSWRCFPPIDGMAHMMGNTKPWKQSRTELITKVATRSFHQNAAKSLWFVELKEINEKYQMGIDLDNWNSIYPALMTNDTLGTLAKFIDQEDALGLKE